MSDSSTIKSAIASFEVLKVFGFASFRIEKGKPVTKIIDLGYLFIWISTGIAFIFLSFTYRDELATTNSKLIDSGNLVAFIGADFIAIISMSLAFIFRRTIWEIVLDLTEVEKMFESIGCEEDYTKETRNVLLVSASIITLFVPLTIGFYFVDGSLLKACLFFYSGLYYMLSVGLVVGCMKAVTMRIKTVNSILKSLLHQPNEVRIVKSQYNDDHEVITTVIEVYAKLNEILGKINMCYGIPTMLGLGLLFFFSIFTNFTAFKNLTTDGHLDNFTVAELIAAVYLHIFMFSVIYVCSLVKSETHKTAILSNRIMKRLPLCEEKEIAMLIMLNHLIKRNSFKFSCGLFDFDWSLVYAVS